MAFGEYPYQQTYFNPNPGYMSPQQNFQRGFQQGFQQTAMMQDGSVQARFVSGREEAVAANVIPGSMCLFIDRANKKMYSKLIDPQTGMPDFREYIEIQPEQMQSAQYATVDDIAALEQRIEQRFATIKHRASNGKAVSANDE